MFIPCLKLSFEKCWFFVVVDISSVVLPTACFLSLSQALAAQIISVFTLFGHRRHLNCDRHFQQNASIHWAFISFCLCNCWELHASQRSQSLHLLLWCTWEAWFGNTVEEKENCQMNYINTAQAKTHADNNTTPSSSPADPNTHVMMTWKREKKKKNLTNTLITLTTDFPWSE